MRPLLLPSLALLVSAACAAPDARSSTRPQLQGQQQGGVDHVPISGELHHDIIESGTLQQDEWADYGPYSASDAGFLVEMSGTGDADLYVRRGAAPELYEFDCRPFTLGSDEQCAMSGAGDYYVSIYGYATEGSDYTLRVVYSDAGSDSSGDEDEQDGEGWSGWSEDQGWESPTNLAFEAMAYAQESQGSGYEAYNLNDGSDYSFWLSQPTWAGKTVWVALEWPSTQSIDYAEIQWTAGFHPQVFDPWVHGAEGWLDLGQEACNGVDSLVEVGMEADALWILLERSNSSSFGIDEIEVW